MSAATNVLADEGLDIVLTALRGFDDDVDTLLDCLARIATKSKSRQHHADLLTVFAGSTDPVGQQIDLVTALTVTIRNLLDATYQPALDGVDLATVRHLRARGADLDQWQSAFYPRDVIAKSVDALQPAPEGPMPVADTKTSIDALIAAHGIDIAYAATEEGAPATEVAATPLAFINQLDQAAANLDRAGIDGADDLDQAADNLADAMNTTDVNERKSLFKRVADRLRNTAAMVAEYRLKH